MNILPSKSFSLKAVVVGSSFVLVTSLAVFLTLWTLRWWRRQSQAKVFLIASTHDDAKPTERCSTSEQLSPIKKCTPEKLSSPEDRSQLQSSTNFTGQRLSSMEAHCENFSVMEDCSPVNLSFKEACSQHLSSLKVCSFEKPSSVGSYSNRKHEISTQIMHNVQRADGQDLEVCVDTVIKILNITLKFLVKYQRLRNLKVIARIPF